MEPVTDASNGIILLREDATLLVEFNSFLQRIARGEISENDLVLSEILTDGVPRRAGELRLFQMVRSGEIRTEELPLLWPDGLMADGPEIEVMARQFLDRFT